MCTFGAQAPKVLLLSKVALRLPGRHCYVCRSRSASCLSKLCLSVCASCLASVEARTAIPGCRCRSHRAGPAVRRIGRRAAAHGVPRRAGRAAHVACFGVRAAPRAVVARLAAAARVRVRLEPLHELHVVQRAALDQRVDGHRLRSTPNSFSSTACLEPLHKLHVVQRAALDQRIDGTGCAADPCCLS